MDSGDNPPVTNLAFFAKRQRTLLAEFIDAAIDHLSPARILVVAAAGKPPASGSNVTTLCQAYSDLAFLDVPISFAQVERQIERWLELEGSAPETILAIDMGWGLETNSAAANFEHWTLVAHRLSSRPGIRVVSLYNRSLLIDEQLLAALRGHPAILTAKGVAANPHWLPADLLTQGTLRQQIDHWLGEIISDPSDPPAAAIHAAEGADPMWLLRRSAEEPVEAYFDRSDRWKIRCFGRLADLSHRRQPGELGDFRRRHPQDQDAVCLSAAERRAGRHHGRIMRPAVAGGGQGRDRTQPALSHRQMPAGGACRASPDAAPACANICCATDRATFSCRPKEAGSTSRRSSNSAGNRTATSNQAHSDEALICLQAADRLYTGDLFEDIPRRLRRQHRARLVLVETLLAARHVLQGAARRRAHSPRTSGFFNRAGALPEGARHRSPVRDCP